MPERPAADPSRALLEACIAGQEPQALALIARGCGLRHYCPRLDIEPLGACAAAGLARAFRMLLSESYFDPHESALEDAMSRAAAHGHVEIAAMAWRYGASLDLSSMDKALDLGHGDAILELMDMGALDSPRGPLPGGLDYFFESACSRGLDGAAAACIARGASGSCAKPAALAKLIASKGMEASARAWLAAGSPLPERIQASWREAFPALMLSVSERDLLLAASSPELSSRKARL